MRRLAALTALAVLLPTHAALAQSQTTAGSSSGLVGLTLASNSIAAVNTEEAQAGGVGAGRKYVPRILGGVWLGSGEGFLVGAGLSTKPFTDARHEILGNVTFLRIEGSNGLGVDVNYVFNFIDTAVGEYSPYAGAGLAFTHFGGDCGELEDLFGIEFDCSSNDTALQIGGGIKRTLSGGKTFGIEAWLKLLYSNPFVLQAVLGW